MDQRFSTRAGNRPAMNQYESIKPVGSYKTPRTVGMATGPPQAAANPMYVNQSAPWPSQPPLPPRSRALSHPQNNSPPVGNGRQHTYEEPDLHGGHVLLSPSDFRSPPGEGSEVHQLKMKVFDLERQKTQLQLSLDESHAQIKQLHLILTEKKEDILKYQEQVNDLQAEAGELRHYSQAPTVTPAEQALQHQIQQCRSQLTSSQQQVDKLKHSNAQLQVQLSQREHTQTHSVDDMTAEVGQLRQENQMLRSRVEVLNHQVSTYSEDFQSERVDRERAQGIIAKLSDERESLQQFIHLLAQEHNIQLENYGYERLAANGAVGNVHR